jgi:hypothetical protein
MYDLLMEAWKGKMPSQRLLTARIARRPTRHVVPATRVTKIADPPSIDAVSSGSIAGRVSRP